MIKLKLIDEWRSFWRMWSVRINGAATVLLGWLLASPDAMLNAWGALPPELRALLPLNYSLWVVVALFVVGTLARIIKQDKIPKP